MWELEARYLAQLVHTCVLAYAPERVVLGGGVMQRLFRVNWQFALFVIYPWAALLAVIGGGFLLGWIAASLLALALPFGETARLLLAAAVALGVLHLAGPRIRKARDKARPSLVMFCRTRVASAAPVRKVRAGRTKAKCSSCSS